ncbi:hydrolase [Paenibacillus yonginensis]|uniref:Hydrolase n=1 Tax=Paenibacillus yonginensis TaxID=1462996 RepID=A0A1B1N6U6_9BACL|nr:C40 family peptidase [Paenibacillus yonginensis]ANS77156.1 hydrolase [Paenibacillus yonginensis]
MKIQGLYKKVITVGICASVGFTGMMLAGQTQASAAADTANTSSATALEVSGTATSTGSKIISYGKKFMGTPYKFGASTSTTKYFDCSSFTKYVFKHYGVTLPRTSKEQAKEGVAVSKANLRVGDLVFFSSGSRANGKNVTHVAIYAGNGKILHTYGKPGVTISNLNSGNWKKTYLKARRVL